MAEMASLLHNLGETDPSRPGGAIVLADMFHRCVGLDVDRWLLRPAVPAAEFAPSPERSMTGQSNTTSSAGPPRRRPRPEARKRSRSAHFCLSATRSRRPGRRKQRQKPRRLARPRRQLRRIARPTLLRLRLQYSTRPSSSASVLTSTTALTTARTWTAGVGPLNGPSPRSSFSSSRPERWRGAKQSRLWPRSSRRSSTPPRNVGRPMRIRSGGVGMQPTSALGAPSSCGCRGRCDVVVGGQVRQRRQGGDPFTCCRRRAVQHPLPCQNTLP